MPRASSRAASPTPGLLAGLLITLLAVLVYSAFTVHRIHQLRELQQDMVDRNRRDSLQLLRIQDNLNDLALAMRDMLDASEPYPLTAWSAQLTRLRRDLDDAIRVEAGLAPAPSRGQAAFLSQSLAQFWDAFDRVLHLAAQGREAEARTLLRDSLQSRHAALTGAVARLLVHNNDAEQEAAAQIAAVYDGVERSVYLFLAAILSAILVTGALLIYSNRRLFLRITDLSAQRSELSRRLIATQEETLRAVSRELHDEFGQILTAIGIMLQRAGRTADPAFTAGLEEIRATVQEALDKVRSLSQTLQPVILEEAGLLAALDWYLPVFQRQTALDITFERCTDEPYLSPQARIHVFRVIQEALNNVVRHSGSPSAVVRLDQDGADLTVEIRDFGKGIASPADRSGIGLVAMRERAALLGGALDIQPEPPAGTLVRLRFPAAHPPAPIPGGAAVAR